MECDEHDVYGNNKGAAGADHIYQSRGSRGQLDHYQRNPDGGHTIAHPVQLAGFQSTDFLGVGTAKGEGTYDCPTYYGSEWQAYFDGRVGFTYFCHQPVGEVDGWAQDVRATIQYMNCNGVNRWGVYFEGDLVLCKTLGVTTGRAYAGGESIGAYPQRVDIDYHDLQYRTSSGTWNDWSDPWYCPEPGYSLTHSSATQMTVLRQ